MDNLMRRLVRSNSTRSVASSNRNSEDNTPRREKIEDDLEVASDLQESLELSSEELSIARIENHVRNWAILAIV